MKRFNAVIVVTALLGIASIAALVQGQDKPADPAGQEQHMQAMMPGEEHKQLARLAGDWTFTSKFSMEGQQPEESTGTAKLMMTLDGRFLHEQNSGSMMNAPYNGIRVIGYNTGTKRYETVWSWTLSTGLLIMTGTSSDGGKTIRFEGSYDEGQGPQKMVVTLRINGDDHFVYEMGDPAQAGGPMLVLDYKRKE
jgi:hypothetical protein